MYHIIGVDRRGARTVVATPPSAAGALTHYRTAADLFPRVIALSPDMEEIDGFELSRRARAEVEP